MNSFEQGFNNFRKSSDSIVGATHGASYVKSVENAINELEQGINKFKGNQTDVSRLKGNIAEYWHSGTHNMDAALKGKGARTFVDASNELGSVDISSNWGDKFGLKYYKDGAESAKQQAKSIFEKYNEFNAKTSNKVSFEEYLKLKNISENDVLRHDPIYSGQVRIIPADQLEEAVKFLKRKIAEESVVRPELVKKYQETLDLLEIKIKSNQGTESIPLAEEDSKKLAELAKKGEFDPAEYGLSTEELVKFNYIMEQALKAGLSAGAISMALKIAPELYKTIDNLIKTGEINSDDLKKMGFAALSGGADGFLRGSVSAGLTTACLSGQFGTALKKIDPTIIGAATVITLNTINYSYKLAKGEMTKGEFADACMRDLFVTTCSLVSGSVTQGFIQIPILGYLIGSFVGSISAPFVYDKGYKSFLSFCCESGFTFFGIVDQNYELPESVLKEMGIDVFEYEKFEAEELSFDRFEFEKFAFETFECEKLEITFIRRGVIGINKIGYVL